MALLAAKAAEVETLQAQRDALARHILKLEEELALARLHRFAPRSEKHLDRVFNEAEQASLEEDTDDGHDDIDEPVAADLPDTGLPEARRPEGKKRGRKALPADLPRQRVDLELGRVAQTDWTVTGREDGVSRVRLVPRTGRTHQLRVHMMSIGHPILGDVFYATGAALAAADRLQLHAEALSFAHPADGKMRDFVVPSPF